MNLGTSLLKQLLSLKKAKDWSDTEIATELGLTSARWSNWKRRGWVAKDGVEATLRLLQAHSKGGNLEPIPKPASKDLVYVNKVDGAHLSGGAGEVLWDFEEIDQSHAFNRDWMQRLGLKPDRCKLWEVRGESMSPSVNPGDLVLINMASREPIAGEVFALITEDGLRIKRLHKRTDGVWEMRSDNPMQHKYPPEAIDGDHVAIIGRVVWRAGGV